MQLTISAPDMSPQTFSLSLTGNQWGGVLGGLPAGTGRTFAAVALDSMGTALFTGQATDVTVLPEQTVVVSLTLQQVNAPPPFENTAPIITSLTATPASVAPGGTVSLVATVVDPDVGATLSAEWNGSAGTFSAPTSLGTVWIAPQQVGSYTLTLVVTDERGASTSISLTLAVTVAQGSADVSVVFNRWPRVTRMTATPSAIAVGETTVASVTATEEDGDTLSYQWTAGCPGNWQNATSSSASFTPSTAPPQHDSCGTCPLTVTVSDGRRGSTTGTLSICVGPRPEVRFPPRITETFQSAATAGPAGGVTLRVKATDARDSTLTFSWQASIGQLAPPITAATQSEVLWTAPACVEGNAVVDISATVTNSLGLATTHHFAVQAQPCGGVRLAASAARSLVVRPDGTVWTWGSSSSYTPVQVQGLTQVRSGAAGYDHWLALSEDGTVWAWGANYFGQLGNGDESGEGTSTPVQVAGLTGIIAIAAGPYHSLAVRADGTVWVWGDNDSGQLGDGTLENRFAPVQVAGLSGVVSVAAGYAESLALRADGTVWYWGNGSPALQQEPTLTGIVSISSGDFSVAALRNDGTVWTGVLGESIYQAPVPTQIVAVSVSDAHGLAVRADGTVWAWGFNGFGELGDGSTVSHANAVQVSGISHAVAVAAGSDHSLALGIDGTVWSWGHQVNGQLGNGYLPWHSSPIPLAGVSNVSAVAACGYHSSVLKTDGTVWGWGYNSFREVGANDDSLYLPPAPVAGLTQGSAIAAGYFHSLAVRTDGSVWAWGDNFEGQLGMGSASIPRAPSEIPGLTQVSRVAAAGTYSLALRTDGTLWAWGKSDTGTLGDGTTTQRDAPAQVAGLTQVSTMAGSWGHVLAVRADGTVWAWGYNANGQLGDGTTTQRLTPIQVPGLSNVSSVAATDYGSLALRTDGTVWAWGNGNPTPMQVPGLTQVRAIAAGLYHLLALRTDGTVWSWGHNEYGQLGDGSTLYRETPVQVPGLTQVSAIAAGNAHSVAVRTDGTVWVWGSNSQGELAEPVYIASPIQVALP